MDKVWIVYLIAQKRGTNKRIVATMGRYWSKFDAYEKQLQVKRDIRKFHLLTKIFYKMTTLTTFEEV